MNLRILRRQFTEQVMARPSRMHRPGATHAARIIFQICTVAAGLIATGGVARPADDRDGGELRVGGPSAPSAPSGGRRELDADTHGIGKVLCVVIALPFLAVAGRVIFRFFRRSADEVDPRAPEDNLAIPSNADRTVDIPDSFGLRYCKSVVSEIDLNDRAASDKLIELGQALLIWKSQYPEINEIIGLNELLGGQFPPFLGGFPSAPDYDPGTGECHTNGECPIVIRSEWLIDNGSESARKALVQSLEANVPKAIVQRISVGQAFRMP